MSFESKSHQLLSKIATNNKHGENSPYFDGWKAYESNPFHPTKNPQGVIQMGLAENQVYFIYHILLLFMVSKLEKLLKKLNWQKKIREEKYNFFFNLSLH